MSTWKRQAIDGLGEVFSNGGERRRRDHESEIRDLHAKIGELTVERDFCLEGPVDEPGREANDGDTRSPGAELEPSMPFLLIRDTPLGKAYVLGTFLTREVTDMGFKVASRVRGLSDEAFREGFGAEEQCRSALSRLRWPDGFVCPACGHRGHCVLAGRSLYQCYRCKKQTSSTAGTIFHATKLPLTLWFAAVHLIVTAKNGISSVELGRRLGVKQPTAWTMKHKIMAVMARREADTPLSGRVEMDDAYLGGARAGGKRGRGAPGKTPFVAAASTSPEGRPRKVKLVQLKGFRKREIARGAKRWLAPGSEVLTDGLRCWNALDGVVGSHRAIRTGSGRQAARMGPSNGSTRRSATSRARSPEPTASSAPIMPNATSPASPGDTSGATSSTP